MRAVFLADGPGAAKMKARAEEDSDGWRTTNPAVLESEYQRERQRQREAC
jgi:hypothetical protein